MTAFNIFDMSNKINESVCHCHWLNQAPLHMVKETYLSVFLKLKQQRCKMEVMTLQKPICQASV